VTFYTSSTSLLGELIGGNAISHFSVLALRGVYATAPMELSTLLPGFRVMSGIPGKTRGTGP
jgi:hypothetical protein